MTLTNFQPQYNTIQTDLSEFLHQGVETFGLGLCVVGHGAAHVELALQFRQTSRVIGLFGSRLLQQRLLVRLAILGCSPLVGICLPECLRKTKQLTLDCIRMNDVQKKRLAQISANFVLSKMLIDCQDTDSHPVWHCH